MSFSDNTISHEVKFISHFKLYVPDSFIIVLNNIPFSEKKFSFICVPFILLLKIQKYLNNLIFEDTLMILIINSLKVKNF